MKPKLIRITTVPLSLEKLLEGQLTFMNKYFEVTAVSAEEARLRKFGQENEVNTFHIEMTREITPGKDLVALLKLYSLFKKEKPTIVHTHTPKAGILGMLAAKLAGVPIRLHTVAGLPLMEAEGAKRKVLNTVEKITYFCATKVYPNSQGLYDYILQENFTSAKKLKVLGKGSSNGIDTEYFDPKKYSDEEKINLKKTLGIPSKDLVLIFVGRIVGDKGINELIEAFVELQKKYEFLSLLLVGPFEQNLNPIKEMNYQTIKINPKIHSLGYQLDVRPYFSISDILIFPSYREGFPNVVMQAGSMGIPSIVTDINGCNEIIKEDVNGTIIPAKDKSALIRAVIEMVEDPEKRKKLGAHSRSVITSQYERKKFWGILLKEYEELIRSNLE